MTLPLPLALLGTALFAAPATPKDFVALGAPHTAVEVSTANGAVAAIRDTAAGIALAPPAELADSFRLVLQLPDQPPVTIVGRDQAASEVRLEGDTLRIRWASPVRDTGGAEHDITVRMTITARGGALTFELQADNRTAGKLLEAWYPLIGGLSGLHAPDAEPDAVLWIPTSTPSESRLADPFTGAAYGYPGHMNMSFACVQSKSARKSLYLASHDDIARYKQYRFTRVEGSDGADVFAHIVHLPRTPPGRTFEGSPVVVRFVDGDWRAAGQVYREWFIETFGIAHPEDDWIRRESFFLMTMFMLPEGTVCYRFRDIPEWARSARDHGLGAVQISGWQVGGHDNGYPDYSVDPRLGTWEELEAGIRECHRMGLKVFFFVNYQPMMVESTWYKNELAQYREMGPDGGLTWLAGWGMGTLWARAGHPKLMTWADLGFPEYRKIIVEQFARLASIGADGVHVDKMFPSAISYNEASPLSPDTSTWEGAVLLTREVMEECRKHNPRWAMSFECNWDRMLEFGCATWWVGNQLITRKVFPEHAETLGLYQAYDYLGVNNAVRDGHIVMVAPQNFTRSMDWPPFRGLSEYIGEVKRIRDRLADKVFFGELLPPGAVEFAGGNLDGVQDSVYRSRTDGRRACILTNSRMEERTVTLVGFGDSKAGLVRVHAPYRTPRTVRLPAEITIAPERIAFVEELGAR